LREVAPSGGGGESEPHLLSKFMGYLNKNKLSNLMVNVNNYYGKNFPIKTSSCKTQLPHIPSFASLP
jgi:hypothetical protein